MEGIDIYKRITDLIIDRMQAGVIPWQQPWKSADNLPQNLVSRRQYHGVNFWLLLSLNHESPYYLSFQQIKFLGGNVIKGQKSVPIVFWKLLDTKDPETGELTKKPFLRYYNVFNLSQTEGIDPAKIPAIEAHDHHFDSISQAEAIVELWKDCPTIKLDQDHAFYSPAEDLVGIPSPRSFFHDEQYYSVLFHELVHSTGHTKRLGRHDKMKNFKFGSHDYSQEELVAEMGAAYLSGICGIEQQTIQNNTAYIQHWIRTFQNDPKVLVIAGSQAQSAVQYVLQNRKSQEAIAEEMESILESMEV
jgi:antirestriction protein ArdC